MINEIDLFEFNLSQNGIRVQTAEHDVHKLKEQESVLGIMFSHTFMSMLLRLRACHVCDAKYSSLARSKQFQSTAGGSFVRVGKVIGRNTLCWSGVYLDPRRPR